MYNNSSTQDKILNFQKTNDMKTLISQIRVTTTITRNSVNVSIGILKLYYIIFVILCIQLVEIKIILFVCIDDLYYLIENL